MPEDFTRILYVEDAEDIAAITLVTLEDFAGFEVVRFADAEQALAAAPGLTPQLLLLDVMLPGMTGVELLARLRELPGYRDVPAVLMTARAQTHEVEEYRTAGVSDVILKPYDPIDLGDRLRRIRAQAAKG